MKQALPLTLMREAVVADDPVRTALIRNPNIKLYDDQTKVYSQGRWFYISDHCMDRFEERREGQTDKLFPHLDLQKRDHQIAALCSFLQQGNFGYTQNVKREKIYGCKSNGWFFVIRDRTVVTCYPTHKGIFIEEQDGSD